MRSLLRDVAVIYATIVACAFVGACTGAAGGPKDEGSLIEGLTFSVVAIEARCYALRRVDDGLAHDPVIVCPRMPIAAKPGDCLKSVKSPEGSRLSPAPCPIPQP